MVVVIEEEGIKRIEYNNNNNNKIRGLKDQSIRIVVVKVSSKLRWVAAMADRGVIGEDPIEVLGSDLMDKIFGYLDSHTLAQSLAVSRNWFSLASSDSLWSNLCDQLWTGKAHIPRCSKVPGLSKLASYSRAVIDSKRVRVMKEDLWDHAWDFHFTEAAPNYWKDLDPYWGRVGPSMRRHFHPDGSITADPEDIVWGGHECSYTIVTGIHNEGNIRENYVRINRWPHLTISRRKDWGWEMSNFVCAYSSVPDACKEGGTGPIVNPKDHLFSWDWSCSGEASKFRQQVFLKYPA